MRYTLPPELRNLTGIDVEKALSDARNHQVIEALAQMTNSYVSQCARLMQAGKSPELVLNQKPTCAIEKIALEMTAMAIRSGHGQGR